MQRHHPSRLRAEIGPPAFSYIRRSGFALMLTMSAMAAVLFSGLTVAHSAGAREFPTAEAVPGSAPLHEERESPPQGAQIPQTADSPPSAAGTSSDDVSKILSLLVTSPERRQLAVSLENFLRDGNLEAAEDRLNIAIEVGSLAVFLTGRLNDPKFLAGLQALRLQAEAAPMPPPAGTNAGDSSPSFPAPDPGELAELREAKAREQQRADATERELATVKEELRTLRKREASGIAENTVRLAQVTASLERERQRADALSQDLASATQERQVLQGQRENDLALVASSRTELNAMKAALEKERLRNTPQASPSSKLEQTVKNTAADPASSGTASSPPPASAPSQTASIPQRTVPTPPQRPVDLRGVPDVIDASTLSLRGQVVRLFGVEPAGDAGSTTDLAQYLGGREVVCDATGLADNYRCRVDGKDLSLVVLFNGGGRVTPNATSELKSASAIARAKGVGIWSKSPSPQ